MRSWSNCPKLFCISASLSVSRLDVASSSSRIRGLENRSPSRIILDKILKIPVRSNIVRSANKYHTIIFFNKAKQKKIETLKKLKIKLIKVPLSNDGNFDLENILMKIKLLGFSRIFLESGLNLTTSFLNENLVDNFYLFISNKNLDKNGNNSFKKNMKLFLKKRKFTTERVNLLGDKLISYGIK